MIKKFQNVHVPLFKDLSGFLIKNSVFQSVCPFTVLVVVCAYDSIYVMISLVQIWKY